MKGEESMEIGLIFKIAAVGIIVSVIGQILKHSGREEQAFLTSLAGLILVLMWIVPYIYDLFKQYRNYLSYKKEKDAYNRCDRNCRGNSGGVV